MKIILSLNYLFFLIFLYLFIYNPPFQYFNNSPVELMILPGILFILISWKWYSYLKIFKVELICFCLILFFSYVREIGFDESVFFRANILLIIESIILPCFLVIYYSKLESKNNLFKEIILIGTIASLFSFFLIINPPLNETIRNQILKTNEFSEYTSFRSFGLSEGLTYGFGVVQGLIFALAFYFSRINSKYLILLPFILLSIIFNARSGLIPVVFILLYFVILKFNFKFIIVFIFIAFLFYFILFKTPFFQDYAQTVEWAFDFFVQTSDFFSGKADNAEVNTFSTLFGEMLIFPKSLNDWLIGSGHNIFISNSGNSDVGYIIQLNYGGLIYLFLLILLIVILIIRLKFLNKQHIWFVLLLTFTIIIGNLKGLFISVNPNFRLVMLIYCYLIIEYRKGIDHINRLFIS